MTFNYGYDDDYLGYGPGMLYNGSLWAYDGQDLNGDSVSDAAIAFDGRMFTYSIGNSNYYDSATGYYSTNIFEGEAYIGAGEPSSQTVMTLKRYLPWCSRTGVHNPVSD